MLFLLALLAMPFACAAPYDVPLDYAPPVLSLEVRLHDPAPTYKIVAPEVKRVPLDLVIDDPLAPRPPPPRDERGFTVEARAAVRVEVLTRSC